MSGERESCTIYLIRHAESVVNANAEQAGQYDEFGSSLTEQGRKQAAALAAALQSVDFAAVYTSDKRRAAETAIMLAHDRPLVSTRALREGPLRDPRTQELETAEGVAERLTAFLQEVAPTYPGQTVGAVTHGYAMRSLLVHLEWSSSEMLPGGSVTNTGYAILHVKGGHVTVLDTVGVHKVQP